MPTVVIRIDMPSKGVLEVTGEGSAPTDDQMAEERRARQEFLDAVSPTLASLVGKPPKRTGNVSHVELLGANVWSQLNHYLVLVSVDSGEPDIDWSALLPPGAEVTTIGSYAPLQRW
jgi:hypothetical protein